MKTFKTPKGTEIALQNLKGKDYMLAAHRLLWFVEENPMYHITENFLVLDDEQTVAQVSIVVLNQQGQAVRKATATKRETKKDFSDHTEKASTGALARALAQLGYGTQFAQQDMEEGTRIVDAPLESVKNAGTPATTTNATPDNQGAKVSSFRRTKKEEKKEEVKPESTGTNGAKSDEWLS